MITIGNDILIKNYAGFDKLALGFAEDHEHTKELMKDNSIIITFNLNVPYSFVRGDYIEYDNEKFISRQNYQPEEKSLQEYAYELKFEGTDMQFQDIIMFYTMQGMKEAQWTLTSMASDFMQIALDNIRRHFNDDSFVLGDVAQTKIENISFDGDSVFDALTTIAETFECEWYLIGKTLHLTSKCEYGDPVVLQREISVAEIEMSNENNEDYCTRLYAFGSTRNIPKNYRSPGSGEAVDAIVQKRLRLPASNGDYIDAIPNMMQGEILERVVRFDDVYPRRVGTITEIRSVDRTEDEDNPFIVYFFKDAGLEFKKDYILEGETLMLTFESGFLQGRDFELAYNDSTQEFEIINDTSNSDLTIPNDILKPKAGDEYVLYGFDISLVSDQYIPEAEKELQEKATEYLKGITEDNATYTCPNVPGYCYQNGIDLQIGQRVQLVSPKLMDGSKNSRIYGFTRKLWNKWICTYLIGDTSRYSRLANMTKSIESTKNMADVQYKENSQNIKLLNYLRTAMSNDTIVKGGIILTTLLRLGATSGNEWKEHAGISGIFEEDTAPAFWAGGTLEDAINLIANPDDITNVAQLVITHGGKIIANEALLRGRFESNHNGDRIVIDPERRAIILKDQNGVENTYWGFENSEDVYSRIRFERSTVDGFITAMLDTLGIVLESPVYKSSLSQQTFKLSRENNTSKFEVSLPIPSNGKLKVILSNLPTSIIGLEEDQLWLNNGKLDLYKLPTT